MRGRRVTVHELAALQLDIRGERAISSSARHRKQATGRPDGRGNIVSSRFSLARRKKRKSSSLGEETDEGIEAISQDNSDDSQPLRKRRKRETYFPEILPFLQELQSPSTGSDGLNHEDENDGAQQPSSDLLKAIHHFASCYYDQRGMLKDTHKLSRIQKSLLSDRSIPKSKRGEGSSRTASDMEEESPLSYEKGLNNSAPIPQKKASGSISQGPSFNEGKPRQRKPNHTRNMYRAFDGSALMAIGIILQMHIRSLVDRPPPSEEEWSQVIQEDNDRISKVARRRGEGKGRPKKERQLPDIVSTILEDDVAAEYEQGRSEDEYTISMLRKTPLETDKTSMTTTNSEDSSSEDEDYN